MVDVIVSIICEILLVKSEKIVCQSQFIFTDRKGYVRQEIICNRTEIFHIGSCPEERRKIMIPRLWEDHRAICDGRPIPRTEEPRKTTGPIGRRKWRDTGFNTRSRDEIQSRGHHKVCERYIPEFVDGSERLSEGIQERIQLWETENIAPLEFHIWRRVLRCHIIYVGEDAVKDQL